MTCLLSHLGKCGFGPGYAPYGKPDRHHAGFTRQKLRSIYSQEVINRKYGKPHNQRVLAVSKEVFADDPRVLVEICRLHHDDLHKPNCINPAELPSLPKSVLEFAADYGLEDRLPTTEIERARVKAKMKEAA